MSEVRKETLDIDPDDFDEILEACKESGYEAKIVEKTRFGNRSRQSEAIQITGHGIETYGAPVVEIHRQGDGVEFYVDLHQNRAKNLAKFQALKSKIHAHYQKRKALNAAKKMGFTISANEETEDKIKITVRKFIS